MGSDDLDGLGERAMPRQVVEMSEYHIDRHEVTFGEYRRCVDAGVCPAPRMESPPEQDPLHDGSWGCRWGRPDIDRYPVACIAWSDAEAYCHWRGAELPTEAQWEKAGRGTDGRVYPWGNEPPTCEYASMQAPPDPWEVDEDDPFALDEGVWGCGSGNALPPGSRSPKGDSPYGVQDMAGNVYEITRDWLGPGVLATGPDPEGPPGPLAGGFKVSKGGSFGTSQAEDAQDDWLHLAWRGQGGGPGTDLHLGLAVGFRCTISGQAS
jgi:formylglycine-generating enzyme required for sulfatase activity